MFSVPKVESFSDVLNLTLEEILPSHNITPNLHTTGMPIAAFFQI